MVILYRLILFKPIKVPRPLKCQAVVLIFVHWEFWVLRGWVVWPAVPWHKRAQFIWAHAHGSCGHPSPSPFQAWLLLAKLYGQYSKTPDCCYKTPVQFLLLLVIYRYLDKWALTGPGRAGDRWKVLDSGWTLYKAAAASTQGCWLGTGL